MFKYNPALLFGKLLFSANTLGILVAFDVHLQNHAIQYALVITLCCYTANEISDGPNTQIQLA